MKKGFSPIFVILLLLGISVNAQFVQNKGQVLDVNQNLRPEVQFYYGAPEASIYFQKDRIVYAFHKKDAFDEKQYENDVRAKDSVKAKLGFTMYRLDMEFMGANPNPEIIHGEKIPGDIHFYLNKRNNIRDVGSYKTITYKNIYNNIDVIFYELPTGLKYDIVLHEGANIEDVKIYYNGAENISIENKKVVIKTNYKTLEEAIPLAFIDGDKANEIEVEYTLDDKGILSFKKPQADYKTLTIDPVLEWATYFNGTAAAGGSLSYYDNYLDDQGNFFIYGLTSSSCNNYPTISPGGSAYISAYNAGYDLYLAKFNANRTLVWSTYLGGGSSEYTSGANTITSYGNTLHIVGEGMSAGAPFTNGGGFYQATADRNFWARFDHTTGQLLHLTTLGGGYKPSIAVSNSGVVAIIRDAYDFNNPVVMNRAGAFNQATNGGFRDMFLMMFNASYNQTWGTFLGGPGTQENFSCTFDNNGNLFFVGENNWSGSSSNATTEKLVNLPGAYYQSTIGGGTDVTLGKFNTAGALVWHTLYGGNNSDARQAQQGGFGRILIHPTTQELILIFNTTSTNLTTLNQSGAYYKTVPTHPSYAGSSGSFWNYASYIAKFSTAGALNYASFWYNTTDGDLIFDASFGGCDKLYLAGRVDYNTVVTQPLSGGFNLAGGRQAFVMQMNSNTYASEWSSFLANNESMQPAISGQPNNARVFISANGYYDNGPTVDPGNSAYYQANNINQPVGNPTAFAYNYMIWQLHPSLPPQVTGDLAPCSGATTTLTASGGTGAPYNWYSGSSGGTAFHTGNFYTTGTLSADVTYYVSSGSGMCESPRTPVTITVASGGGTAFTVTGGGNLCSGGPGHPVGLSGSQSGVTYQLYLNGFTQGTPVSGTGSSISFGVQTNAGNYTVITAGGGACATTMTGSVTINVVATPSTPNFTVNSPVCSGSPINFNAPTVLGATYVWSGPNSFTSSVEDPAIAISTTANTGTYNLYIVENTCTSGTTSQTVTVNAVPNTPSFTTNAPICEGNALNLTGPSVSGATYVWSGPNSFSSAIQSPSIAGSTVANAGTYNLSVVVAGCTSSVATQNVVVNPAPAIALGTVVQPSGCGSNNGSIQITGTGTGNISWTGGASGSATSVTLPYNMNSLGAGTYNVLFVAAGCTSNVVVGNLTTPSVPATPIFTSPSTLCSGNTLTLDAPTVTNATYVWSGPNSFSASTEDISIPNATATNGGTYSLYVVVNNCTSAIATQNITINTTPALPSFTSNSPICSGNQLNLTGPAVTGATYNWTGPNSFSSAIQSPNIPNSAVANSGTYNLYVVADGCTSATATQSVVVNPTPVIAGVVTNPSACGTNNGSIQITGTGSGSIGWTGTTFGAAPSITLPHTISNLGTGTYNVIFISSAACTSNVVVSSLTNPAVPATPAFTANSPLCAGSNITFDAPTVANATYVWSGPNSFTSSVEDPSITSATTAASGSYNLYVVVSNCTSATATQSVVVNVVPTVPTFTTNSPVCEGNTLNLTGPTVAGGIYTWSGPSGFTSAVQSPSITNTNAAHAGTYNLSVSQNGCTSAVASQNVIINPVPVVAAGTITSPTGCGSTDGSVQITGTGTGSIGWTGTSTGFNLTATLPHNINNLGAGTYSIAFVSAAGCTSNVVVANITSPPNPATPAFTTNTPVCVGNTISFTPTAVSNATYVWSGPNSFTSTSTNPTITSATAASAGTYSMYVVVNNCTSAATTQSVVVNPAPALPTFTSNSPICSGSTLTLNGPTVTGATYTWNGPNGFTASTEDASISGATSAASGTYGLYVTVSGCTSATSTQTLTVYDIPLAPALTANGPICQGSNLILTANASNATSYNWSGPNGWVSNTQNPAISNVTAANNGIYNAYAIIGSCTSAVANITVVIITPPSISYSGSLSNCGPNVPLSATVTPVGSTIDWFTPLPAGSGSNISYNYTGTLPSTLNAFVTATNAANCSDTVFFSIQLFENPVADFTFEDLCDSSSVDLNEQHTLGGNGNATFEWFWNGGSSTLPNPTNNFGQPGTYPVTLIVTNAGTPCKDTIEKNITILSIPILSFSSESKCLQEVIFTGTSLPVDSTLTNAQWSFGDGESGSGNSTTHTYLQPNTYTVTWSAENANACVFTVSQSVEVKLSKATIPNDLPNVFTPNGDVVNNTIDFDEILGECGEYEAVIYNRWGTPVFNQKNGTQPFIGKTPSGTSLSEGVYYYVLRYGESQKGGSITLAR